MHSSFEVANRAVFRPSRNGNNLTISSAQCDLYDLKSSESCQQSMAIDAYGTSFASASSSSHKGSTSVVQLYSREGLSTEPHEARRKLLNAIAFESVALGAGYDYYHSGVNSEIAQDRRNLDDYALKVKRRLLAVKIIAGPILAHAGVTPDLGSGAEIAEAVHTLFEHGKDEYEHRRSYPSATVSTPENQQLADLFKFTYSISIGQRRRDVEPSPVEKLKSPKRRWKMPPTPYINQLTRQLESGKDRSGAVTSKIG